MFKESYTFLSLYLTPLCHGNSECSVSDDYPPYPFTLTEKETGMLPDQDVESTFAHASFAGSTELSANDCFFNYIFVGTRGSV